MVKRPFFLTYPGLPSAESYCRANAGLFYAFMSVSEQVVQTKLTIVKEIYMCGVRVNKPHPLINALRCANQKPPVTLHVDK